MLFVGVMQEYGASAFEATVRSNYYDAPRHYVLDAVLDTRCRTLKRSSHLGMPIGRAAIKDMY
ncbi:hypothetical protein N9L68_09310 [bacterium]|nr:hypothetical protein [bacterium]